MHITNRAEASDTFASINDLLHMLNETAERDEQVLITKIRSDLSSLVTYTGDLEATIDSVNKVVEFNAWGFFQEKQFEIINARTQAMAAARAVTVDEILSKGQFHSDEGTSPHEG